MNKGIGVLMLLMFLSSPNVKACSGCVNCFVQLVPTKCNEQNVCDSDNFIHHLEWQQPCRWLQCPAGCTVGNLCAYANTLINCGACTGPIDTNMGIPCGGSPPPPLSPPPPPPIPPPPPPPPIGPCGPNTLCGNIKDAETNSVNLKDIPIQIRDANGKVVATTATNGSGNFSFTPTLAGSYYVEPVVSRTTVSVPIFSEVTLGSGNKTDFKIRFEPTSVKVVDKPGTFLLFTSVPWPNVSPPNIPGPVPSISAIIDLNGERTTKVRGNSIYWLTCWIFNGPGAGYTKLTSKQVSPFPLVPQTEVGPITCN